MGRPHRVHYEGALYHVMLRGNNAQEIFFNDFHRQHFCNLVAEALRKFSFKVHAFCLMSNHVHFLVEVNQTRLSKIVQFLASTYSLWLNKDLGRMGHSFQSRYKAILVEDDSYLIELVRYIHLNPVRAKLISEPSVYFWSGHNDYMGAKNFPWLTTTYILSLFINYEDQSKAYANFLAVGMGCPIELCLD